MGPAFYALPSRRFNKYSRRRVAPCGFSTIVRLRPNFSPQTGAQDQEAGGDLSVKNLKHYLTLWQRDIVNSCKSMRFAEDRGF
jgi:hypothetical protein